MLYIIGLGLNENSLTLEGLEAIKKCKRVYLDKYTVKFPYEINKLEEAIDKRIVEAGRDVLESNFLIEDSKNKEIALLVYGSPLFATTHISLIWEAKKEKVKVKIIHNASIFDALGETGLQLYKFGKITSMPKWSKYELDSFLDIVLENEKINAHSLILIDIGLSFENALSQLEKSAKNKNIKIDKLIVCSRMGSESKVFYNTIRNLKKEKVSEPFCFIIPGKLHFLEEEFLGKV